MTLKHGLWQPTQFAPRTPLRRPAPNPTEKRFLLSCADNNALVEVSMANPEINNNNYFKT